MLLTVELITLVFVVVLLFFTLRDKYYERYYPRFETELDDMESWTCEYCGYTVYCVNIEGIVEGMRIHQEAIYCPGEENEI
jgi:hypothetical protein